MNAGRSFIIAGASLFLGGAVYAHGLVSEQGPAVLVTGQSQSQSQGSGRSQGQDQRMQDQAKESRQQPSHTEFGGQPADQAARERHHQQYPESAQHLGPQEGDHPQGAQRSGGEGGQGSRQDAVSGVGK